MKTSPGPELVIVSTSTREWAQSTIRVGAQGLGYGSAVRVDPLFANLLMRFTGSGVQYLDGVIHTLLLAG